MLCDDCQKRPASVHITQITNNQKIDKHLCNQCAQAYGDIAFSLDSKFSVHDFLKNMFYSGAAENVPAKSGKACANCGMTYHDFSRTGKFGCSACYSTFGDHVEPLLRRIHGVSTHTGKLPRRTGATLELKQRIKKLRYDLERHIVQEKYEDAAKIRDEIRGLEKKLSSSVSEEGNI